jgi:hypothetical protein
VLLIGIAFAKRKVGRLQSKTVKACEQSESIMMPVSESPIFDSTEGQVIKHW